MEVMKLILLQLIIFTLTSTSNNNVITPDLTTILWNLEDLVPEFKKVSHPCRNTIRASYKEAMVNLTDHPDLLVLAIALSKKSEGCKSEGDKDFFVKWTDFMYVDVKRCMATTFPACSMDEFYRDCWIGSMNGLHYIPPFVTDITTHDIQHFPKKFSRFSSENRRDTCCLIQRATECFNNIAITQCSNMELFCARYQEVVDLYLENLGKSINKTYFQETEKILKCRTIYGKTDTCDSPDDYDGGSRLGFSHFSFFFILFPFL